MPSWAAVLFWGIRDVQVEALCDAGGVVRLSARSSAPGASCPGCGAWSSRVHDWYVRSPGDCPLAGRPVVVELRVRRFACGATECPKRTFAEQIPGLTFRHGRTTVRLRAALERIGLALAGRAGARLSAALGVRTGRMTLLRLVKALPDPESATPRALGVDDFALKRGHVYATVLTDAETHRVVDVLPGRDAAPLAAWLDAHPGVEVVCRDRAGAYAEGARQGAPDAVQVADRFHLWQNLGQAVERAVAAHRPCLAEPVPATAGGRAADTADSVTDDPDGRFADRARAHHALVHGLLDQGLGIRAIARHLGWGRHTVQRYARAATWQQMVKGRLRELPSKLDPFKEHLRIRWESGATNILALHREITVLGFDGSYSTVHAWLAQFQNRPATPPPAPPSVRRVTGWLTRHPDSLTGDEKQQLKAVLARCPELDATARLVRRFGVMLTTLSGEQLPDWITAASETGLPGISPFARGLEADLDAVGAGLTLSWNSGATEGAVNRIKALKRQTYGRAGFTLLRKRILLA